MIFCLVYKLVSVNNLFNVEVIWYRLQWIYSYLHFRIVVPQQNNCLTGYHTSLLYCCWNSKHILISGPWQFISEQLVSHHRFKSCCCAAKCQLLFNQICNNLATLSQQKNLSMKGQIHRYTFYLWFTKSKGQITPVF